MAPKLMGKKRGMIQLFDEKGNNIVGTVIELQPNVIVQSSRKTVTPNWLSFAQQAPANQSD